MAITYTWEVFGIRTTTLNNTPNVVVQTYWRKIGEDENGNVGTFNGATPFSAESMPAGVTFIPFEQLTEADVLSWIKAIVVDSYEEHVNGQILKQINDAKNPIIDAPLPWAPVETVSEPVTETANVAANTANT
jgi:hypothetical protein